MNDLDAPVTAWIERVADGEVVGAAQVSGGGRIGFTVDVKAPDGTTRPLFLQRGGRAGVGSFMGQGAGWVSAWGLAARSCRLPPV